MLVIMEGTLRRHAVNVLLRDCGLRRTGLGEAPHKDEAAGDVRRAMGIAPLEVTWCLAHHRPEPAAERAEAGEAHDEAHLGDREVRGPQQVLGSLDPSPRDV